MTLIEDHDVHRVAPRRPPRRGWSEEELVRAARAGDGAAFDVLFARHRPAVERAALAVLGDRAEAQDAVQLTFVKTWRAAARLDPARPFGPWVRTVARRVAVDLARSRTRRQLVAAPDDEPVASAEATGALAAERHDVRAALARLPDVERNVLVLTYFGGLTQPEVAARLGVPVGTVKSRTHRAHRTLHALLQGG